MTRAFIGIKKTQYYALWKQTHYEICTYICNYIHTFVCIMKMLRKNKPMHQNEYEIQFAKDEGN